MVFKTDWNNARVTHSFALVAQRTAVAERPPGGGEASYGEHCGDRSFEIGRANHQIDFGRAPQKASLARQRPGRVPAMPFTAMKATGSKRFF
jgi:hypothetical protein